ncbi:Uncharacterised protein [Yersinia intermedia]|jgi:hypothetical protein|uniref:hypothetical protein n=1 Tax=Yersinia intermedia TaxID=631 RepID=UPI00005FAA0D|nr:hypothetical protein [Yersinia intermedia]VDZ51401.1 Uncharacterised protein [Yersinia intermedia]
MRRCYFFTHIKTVSHEAWSELCRAISRVHNRVRNESGFCWLGKPLTVYDHSGTKPLRYDDSMVGLGVISFNGDFGTGLSGDPLCLVRLFSSERQQSQCDTGHHPYDFMVMAVLLLVNHYCPTCYALHSTVERTEWQQISDWLNTHLHLAVMLPPGLQQTDAIIG